MNLERFLEFLDSESFEWTAKRLSGNDTGITGGHQVGLYLPREFFERCFPEICITEELNPKSVFKNVEFPQLKLSVSGVTATYYNNKYFNGTRNEFRLTRWGGRANPLQNHDNTGAIIVLAFRERDAKVWIADSPEEEDHIEFWIGRPVEPKHVLSSWIEPRTEEAEWKLPEEWSINFPSGLEIFQFIEESIPFREGCSVDHLLMTWRVREFEVFKVIEQKHILPSIKPGFRNIEQFLKIANSVTNRRKSRSGKSLELALESIFRAKHLRFETQVKTERKSQPDFLFPSLDRYRAAERGSRDLIMLAAKTCCKDRWRQIVREADKIPIKHLFTLQEGVSLSQIFEMKNAGVKLVVPSTNVNFFPASERPWLMDLQNFCSTVEDAQK